MTSTRTTARDDRRDEIGELRIEAERVDRIAAARAAGATRPNGDSVRAIAVDVEPVVASPSSRLRSFMPPPRGWSGSGRRRPTRTARAAPVCVGRRSVRPSALDGAAAVAGAAVAQQLDDVRRDRRAGDLGRRARSRPRTAGAPAADAAAEAHRLPRRRRARPDDVARAVVAALDRGDHRLGGVVGVQQRERRVGERGHRHDRQAQQPPSGLGTCEPTTGAYRSAHTRHAVAQRARPRRSTSTSSSDAPYGVRGAGIDVFVGHRRVAACAGRRPRARCAPRRTRGCRRARRRSASRSCTARCARAPTPGVMRDAGSYTPKCATTVGAKSSTNSASRSRSRGSMRRNSARRSRRRGGTKSTPTTSPAHGRCSISCATRVPSSPPIPVTSTRSLRSAPYARLPPAAGAGTGSPRGST